MRTKRNFLLLILFAPLLVAGATLININTADSASLQTLNGIGPSKAQAIIDYRTQHGAFTSIDQIMQVSGIGTVTYNNIKDFITVSDSSSGSTATSSQSDPQTQSQTQTQTQTQTSAGGSNGPPVITAHITAPTGILVGAGSVFAAQAFDAAGEPLQGVRFIWNFGDGVMSEGASVLHTYTYPGAYEVVLTAAYNYSTSIVRLPLEAAPAQVALYVEGDGSLTIGNKSGKDFDVGLWQIVQGSGLYTIPPETLVFAGKGLRFGATVLGFAGSEDARLLYPNRTVAASAQTSVSSPKHGETVNLSPAANPSQKQVGQSPNLQPPPTVKGDVLGASTDAPAGDGNALWLALGGLVAVILLGGAAAWYLQLSPAPAANETDLTAEEFDIEG